MPNHSPLPWKSHEEAGEFYGASAVIRSEKRRVADCGRICDAQARANAALIVRAVNRDHRFEAAIEALEAAGAALMNATNALRRAESNHDVAIELGREALKAVHQAIRDARKDV